MVFLAKADYLSQDLRVKSIAFCFQVDILNVSGYARLLLFQPLNTFNKRFKLVGGYGFCVESCIVHFTNRPGLSCSMDEL